MARRHKTPRKNRRQDQAGFAMMLVFLMASVVAITLYLEIPRIAMQTQRDKEQLLIDRGEQYKRAIQLFYKKANRYPADIKDLESFQNQRFLRQRYIDPMTGKDEWRLIHVQGGMLTDSKITKPQGPGQQKEGGGSTGGQVVGEQLGLGMTPTQQGGGPASAKDRRRPSEGGNATMPGGNMPGGNMPGGNMPGGDVSGVQTTGIAPMPGQPQQPGTLAGQGNPNYPGGQQYPGMNGQPGQQVPGANGQPGQYPGANGQPGQQFPGMNGQPVTGLNGQPVTGPNGQPVYPPGMPAGAQIPGQIVQPGMPGGIGSRPPTGTTSGTGGSLVGGASSVGSSGSLVGGSSSVGSSGSSVGGGGSYVGGVATGAQPGNPGQPGFPGQTQYPGQTLPGQPGPPVNSQNPGTPYQTAPGSQGSSPPGYVQPGAATGQPNAAADMIRNILTTPRPGGMPTANAGGQTIGGGIAGVASNSEGEGVKRYQDHSLYSEWEFVFDPQKQKQIPNPNAQGAGGTPVNQMGSPAGAQQPGQNTGPQQPGQNTGPGFGQGNGPGFGQGTSPRPGR